MSREEWIEKHLDRVTGRIARCAGLLRCVLADPKTTEEQAGGALNFATQSARGLLGMLWDDLAKVKPPEAKAAPANGAQTRKG